jgi:hypothetical protein
MAFSQLDRSVFGELEKVYDECEALIPCLNLFGSDRHTLGAILNRVRQARIRLAAGAARAGTV